MEWRGTNTTPQTHKHRSGFGLRVQRSLGVFTPDRAHRKGGQRRTTEPCLLFQYHRANSVTWNPHKMMGVPLQCSAILVREKVRQCSSLQSSPPSCSRVLLTPVCCRDYCKAATPCVLVTCSSKTNSMMSRTTRATRPFSVDATWTSSSSGLCGRQRFVF